MKTLTITMMVLLGAAASPSEPALEAMTKVVARIQRADYEGDRKTLLSLAGEMAPFTKDGTRLSSRALYWRGFALWRRALNGFNDSTDPKELEKDLTEAVKDFTGATVRDPEFADAKVAAAACVFTLMYLNKDDAERRQAYLTQGIQLMAAVRKAAPENPRFLWVQGGGEWFVPPERGGGQGKAIETYERGLQFARKQKGSVSDPLEPTWGEPELLMNLAWSQLNRATPDVEAAEANARAALAIVPYWHYLRDILMPQIRAKAEASTTPTTVPTPRAADAGKGPASPTDFDFLEGKWAIVYNNAQPGIPPNVRGTWTATKQADGRVLYDEFRLFGADKQTVFLCATYRVFDDVRQQWDMRYVGLRVPGLDGVPHSVAQWADLNAWRDGSTIRVDQHGGSFQLRITYYDIGRDHFRWKADVSSDGGKTWQNEQIRIEATRAASSGSPSL